MVPAKCCFLIRHADPANQLTIRRHGVHDAVIIDHEQIPLLRTADLWRDLVWISSERPELVRAFRTLHIRSIERAEVGRLEDARGDPAYVASERVIRREDLSLELLQQLLV